MKAVLTEEEYREFTQSIDKLKQFMNVDIPHLVTCINNMGTNERKFEVEILNKTNKTDKQFMKELDCMVDKLNDVK